MRGGSVNTNGKPVVDILYQHSDTDTDESGYGEDSDDASDNSQASSSSFTSAHCANAKQKDGQLASSSGLNRSGVCASNFNPSALNQKQCQPSLQLSDVHRNAESASSPHLPTQKHPQQQPRQQQSPTAPPATAPLSTPPPQLFNCPPMHSDITIDTGGGVVVSGGGAESSSCVWPTHPSVNANEFVRLLEEDSDLHQLLHCFQSSPFLAVTRLVERLGLRTLDSSWKGWLRERLDPLHSTSYTPPLPASQIPKLPEFCVSDEAALEKCRWQVTGPLRRMYDTLCHALRQNANDFRDIAAATSNGETREKHIMEVFQSRREKVLAARKCLILLHFVLLGAREAAATFVATHRRRPAI
eukprot:GHVR01082634.1.p1 GENE.GHVR01082634.1~~GHVR01082634.1.p1  ORF type:complete len:357 (+),score=83.05 GHVR01082634.1:99-1169(+)